MRSLIYIIKGSGFRMFVDQSVKLHCLLTGNGTRSGFGTVVGRTARPTPEV
jgi:hypothetical protein